MTDRFLLRAILSHPDDEDERRLLRGTRDESPTKVTVSAAELIAAQAAVFSVHIDHHITDFIQALATATRRDRFLQRGLSTRAALMLVHAAKARALLFGRDHVVPDDVRALLVPVCSHRLALSVHGALEGGDIDGRLTAAMLATPLAVPSA
jgi:MoxR-like ATPase